MTRGKRERHRKRAKRWVGGWRGGRQHKGKDKKKTENQWRINGGQNERGRYKVVVTVVWGGGEGKGGQGEETLAHYQLAQLEDKNAPKIKKREMARDRQRERERERETKR